MALDLGAIIAGIGGLANAFTANKQNKALQDLTSQNLAQSQQNAANMFQLATAPVTDAIGNRTSYSTAGGFKTELSDTGQGLLDKSIAEQLAQFGDLNQQRTDRQTNALRRTQEGTVADALLSQFANRKGFSVDDLKNAMIEKGQIGLNRGFEQAEGDIMRQATRSMTDAQVPLADIAQRRAESLRSNMLDAEINAPQLVQQLEAADIQNKLNPYNLLASRASNYDNIAFTPSNVADVLANRSVASQQAGTQAIGSGQVLTNNALAQLASVPQNNFMSQLGIGLGGLASEVTGQNQADKDFQKQLLMAIAKR